MNIYISSLIRGMDGMEEVALWINSLNDPKLGVELIAFTHDEDYWERLKKLIPQLTCPVSFHGPYVATEATAYEGSKEYNFLLESYEKVFRLAQRYDVSHIVFHSTQLSWKAEDFSDAQIRSIKNTKFIIDTACSFGVHVLVENLAYPSQNNPLFDNDAYDTLFATHSNWGILMDIGHAHINKMEIEGFLQKYSDRVSGYHFHNNDGTRDAHNDISNGTFNFAKFANIYKRYTPDASIVLEYEPHVSLTDKQLLDQVNWVRIQYNTF